VSVTNGSNVTLVDANALNLGAISITGNLLATATAGDITNTGALTIGGNSSFVADAAGASISVNNAGNNFTGSVSFSGAGGLANVTVVDTTALDLGATTVHGQPDGYGSRHHGLGRAGGGRHGHAYGGGRQPHHAG
jgi:hypothetical protein